MSVKEKGFTLIEVLIATALVTIIAGAATTSLFQAVSVTEKNNEHISAILQAQNAGFWVSRDAQNAQIITTENLTSPEILSITWTDWDNDDQHQIVYSLQDMATGSLKYLQRSETINEGSPAVSMVAQYIDPSPGQTSCEFSSGRLTFTVTANVSFSGEDQSEKRIFVILPRPGS